VSTTYTTLECDGVEKSLGDWGFDLNSCRLTHVNLRQSTFQGRIVVPDMTAEPIFGFESRVILRRGRVGSGTSYTGGASVFVGYTLDQSCTGRPRTEEHGYTFGNAWYLVERTVYQQSFASRRTTQHDVEYPLVSELILFTRLDEQTGGLVACTNGQQIEDILRHVSDTCVAQGLAEPFVVGRIDPDLLVPPVEVRELMCDKAIEQCLDLAPNCQVVWDYSTVPPIVSVLMRASLAPVDLTIANGVDFGSVDISPLQSLVPKTVIVNYKITVVDEGTSFYQYVRDKYPADGPDGGPGVVIQTVDLVGPTYSSVVGALECLDATAANSNDPGIAAAWWAQFHPKFADAKTLVITIGNATFYSTADGSVVNVAAYPNFLRPGGPTVLPWMTYNGAPVVGIPVQVRALVAYEEWAESSHATRYTKVSNEVLTANITLTNGVTGSYSSETITYGEQVPQRIAQAVFEAMQLQYEGQIELVEETPTGQVGLGNSINLTDPNGNRPNWSSMAAIVQRVMEQEGTGRTTIVVGPRRHIDSGNLAALLKFNRNRRYWYNTGSRSDPSVGAG